MAIPVTKVLGIGPHSATILGELGYKNAEDIATSTVEDLAKVPGFGSARATKVLAAAKELTEISAKEKDDVKELKKLRQSKKGKSKSGKKKAKKIKKKSAEKQKKGVKKKSLKNDDVKKERKKKKKKKNKSKKKK